MFVTRDIRASTSDSVESTESLVGKRATYVCPRRSCACECEDGFVVFYASTTVLAVIGICVVCFKLAGFF
jgi:hypothetical protein